MERSAPLEELVVFSGASDGLSALPAAKERNALLEAADQLNIELGYVGGEVLPDSAFPVSRCGGMALRPEDEMLVASARGALARLAAALEGGRRDELPESQVAAALDSAELVIRGKLMTGNKGQLPILLPGIVFLVALPVVDQERALEISGRAAQLVEGALD